MYRFLTRYEKSSKSVETMMKNLTANYQKMLDFWDFCSKKGESLTISLNRWTSLHETYIRSTRTNTGKF